MMPWRQKLRPSHNPIRPRMLNGCGPIWITNPAFYGSAAALLDHEGNVTASPYVYRTSEGYVTLDLAVPSYNIDSQDWVQKALGRKCRRMD